MWDSRWHDKLRLRLRSLFRRDEVERDLDDEMRFYIEQRTEHEIASGRSPEEARRVAERALEGIEQKKEECRDVRGVNFIDTLGQDIRYAFRGMRKSPGFSAVAILTLALGIGASMAILPIVNTMLVRPLPFPNSRELVALYATTPTRTQDVTSFPDFTDWKQQSRSLANAAAYRRDPFAVVTGGGAPEPLQALRATHEILNVLGVAPSMGRGFDRREQETKAAVVLISDGLWRRRYGGDPQILGRTITLSDVNHTIVGVLPPRFEFPPYMKTDILLPVPEEPGRGRGYLRGVARLRPGTPVEAAQYELDVIAARLEKAYPPTNEKRGVNVMPLQTAAAGAVRTPLLVLLGAAAFVLLIGCANVGNLVLARGIARQREFALRSALGAGAGRLVRQLLTESTMLAAIAALTGAALAYWTSSALVYSLSKQFALPEIAFDWRLLAAAVATALLAGALCGLPPALMIWRSRLNNSLKDGGRGQSSGRSEQRLRSLLVVSETALTVVLLMGAGLMIKSFVLLQQTDLGLNPRNVLMADLLLSKKYSEPQRREVFLRDVLESVKSLPGVQQAAMHRDQPFQGGGSRMTFNVEGHADPGPRVGHTASFNVVSDGFFDVMGMALKRGRAFDQRDIESSAPVAIVNETMARRFWPNENAAGKRIKYYYDRYAGNDPQQWLTIVGVVGDSRYQGRDLEPVPQVFVPQLQDPYRHLNPEPYTCLVVKTSGDPAAMASAVQKRIWDVDRDQPILHMSTMDEALSQSIANRQLYLLLLGSFAAIALVMAAAGIYGLIAYSVARRTQEMGIRIALGATTRQIMAMVIRHGMLLTLAGVAIGIAASLVLTRVISGLLFGVTATDAPTFVVVTLVFVATALAATGIPARRAAAVDPSVAFRYE